VSAEPVVENGRNGAGVDIDAERQKRLRSLGAGLREMAILAAKKVGGGVALVFASAPGDDSDKSTGRLRTAAGFSAPQAARDAARHLGSQVRDVILSATPQHIEASAPLGERAAAGLEIVPLIFDDRTYGALVVGSPGPIDDAGHAAIHEAACNMALRLDHARLVDEASGPTHAEVAVSDEKGEELLKLSEALFERDIELLRNNEKLGKIEKLKNDFIEKMSKELRTPLNSIIEAIISVLTGENEALSDAAKKTMRGALDDGTAFLRTLQNILDLWKIKQNELPAECQELNFREVVDEAIFSIQDVLDGKTVEIQQMIEEPFPTIRTDLAKLSQILFLLLDNAVKFTQKGHIAIAARIVNDQLLCEIRDTGIGICRDDQDFIFDEFFQVDDGTSDRYRGAGLGLALVRDLLRLLSGDVSVTSEAGHGTTVTFQVPVQVVT
jgi:signal transduction histidine kinase